MDDPEPGQKICTLYLIENWQLFYGNFIRPKIKVGTEWVYKGQNADNCLNSVAALARTMYNRLFLWLVDLCNRTLIDQTMKSKNTRNNLDTANFPQRSTSSASSTSLVLRSSNSIRLNKSASTSVTKSSSNSSTIICKYNIFPSKESV